MPFDGLVLAAVTKELEEKLVGGRVERVYQPGKEEITLTIHRAGTRGRLLLSAHALNARVHLTTATKENPVSPPLFCMVLRKYLEGSRIIRFEQPELERVLLIEFESRDELGNPSPKQLICEIMGKHSNIILVDSGTNVIVDGIKRYSHAVSRYREVLPGRPYLSPPPQKKINPFTAREEQFSNACLNKPLETALPVLLQKCLSGMSAVTCQEIVFRANLSPGTLLEQCGDYEFRALWQALRRFIQPAATGLFEPCLTQDSTGKIVDFAALHLNYSGLKLIKNDNEMNTLLDLFFSEREKQSKIQKEKNLVLKLLRKESNKLKKKLNLYNDGLSKTTGADQLQLYGELLTANIYQLTDGLQEIVVQNYYANPPQPVTIPLEPHLSPAENAQAYFKKYVKLKNTRSALAVQIAKVGETLDYVEGVRMSLEQADTIPDLEEIKQELVEQGFMKQPLPAKISKKKIKNKTKPQVWSLHSSDGFPLYIGKNNKQNDFLTLRFAQENDIWLHVKDTPGAHVIIKTEGQTIPPSTLMEAASLAAFFSKARQSSKVPVDYTQIKHVSKPKNARPGMVIYQQQKTIMAGPDEELFKKLAGRDGLESGRDG